MAASSGALRAPHPAQRRGEAATRGLRQLLDKLVSYVSAQEQSGALPDMDAWPPQAARNFAVIVGQIQADPRLIADCSPQQRTLLLRLMVNRFPSVPGVQASAGAGKPAAAHDVARTGVRTEPAWSIEDAVFPKTIDLLGGSRLLRHKPSNQAEIHAAVVDGIPYAVLFFLTTNAKSLSEDDVAYVIGVSPRTLRRQKDTPQKTMPADLGSKTWLLAETLARAEDLFGGREEAERWMIEEAMGLDGARPIDMLRTLQGANLVNQFLERLKYGVYN